MRDAFYLLGKVTEKKNYILLKMLKNIKKIILHSLLLQHDMFTIHEHGIIKLLIFNNSQKKKQIANWFVEWWDF